jgi:hypothetical protein
MPFWNDDASYWKLVQQLMHLGWYRIRTGPAQDPGKKRWGFREGHTIDGSDGQSRWVAARDEQTAMHILLSELTGQPWRGVEQGPPGPAFADFLGRDRQRQLQ